MMATKNLDFLKEYDDDFNRKKGLGCDFCGESQKSLIWVVIEEEAHRFCSHKCKKEWIDEVKKQWGIT